MLFFIFYIYMSLQKFYLIGLHIAGKKTTPQINKA